MTLGKLEGSSNNPSRRRKPVSRSLMLLYIATKVACASRTTDRGPVRTAHATGYDVVYRFRIRQNDDLDFLARRLDVEIR